MEKGLRFFTSESVTEGHPDKVCDLIADSILDEALSQDESSRVACEVCATTGLVMIMGEFTIPNGYIDIPKIVRNTVKEIGYTDAAFGFDYKTCSVITTIDEQSPDIAMGVDNALENREKGGDLADITGAGDQGMMFGFACNETDELMPLPLSLAHKLTKALTDARKHGLIKGLRPDGKAQVTIAYDGNTPLYADAVVLSTQHDPDIDYDNLRSEVLEKVIKPVIGKYISDKTKFYINPTGQFIIGGPQGDSGLTGRKIIVDTYGGMCPHGGGSFSGKDPTKVDRSAAYYARYVCKNVVAAGLAERCELQVAYAIGKARPISLCINTFSTGKYDDKKIEAAIERVFDFRPYSIIKNLELRKPIYAKTSNYGHFGKVDLAWEKTDKKDELIKVINSL